MGLALAFAPSNLTVATFDPSSISGLLHWYKADALSLNDGDAVATWTDSGSGGANATQSSAGLKPTYKTGIVNSKPVVRFDGGDSLSATFTLIAQPDSVYIVHKYTGGAGQQDLLDATGSNRQIIYSGVTATAYGYYAGSVQDSATNRDTTNWHILTSVFNGASSVQYLDGTSIQTANPGTSGLDNIVLGSVQDALSGFFTGDMAEVLIYNSALSTTDRNNVHNYLGSKYGITVT